MSKPSITGSAETWDAIERAGFPDIRGVWIPTHSRGIVVVAIAQRYPSHARQVGTFVASTSYMGRFVIVVDDDVDVTNLDEVMWAVGTRCDPVTSITLMDGMRSSALDPRLSPEKREKRDFTNSIAVIDACRPFTWRKSFPELKTSLSSAPPLSRPISAFFRFVESSFLLPLSRGKRSAIRVQEAERGRETDYIF